MESPLEGNGCPQVGVLFQLRKHAKSRYRYAVRRVLRNQDKLRHKKLADALLEDKSRNFWQEVKQFKAGKQRCSQMVDGITGDENLVKLWFSKFKDLLSSPSPDRAQQLADALNSLDLSSRDLDSLVISEDVVLNAVRKLKWGKSEAGLLSSDHLIFAPASFARVLAPVFTALLRHGHIPLCLGMRLSSQSLRVGTRFHLSQKTIEA